MTRGEATKRVVPTAKGKRRQSVLSPESILIMPRFQRNLFLMYALIIFLRVWSQWKKSFLEHVAGSLRTGQETVN
jgi:hypothetical protein